MKKSLIIICFLFFLPFFLPRIASPATAADMPSFSNPIDNLQVPLPSGYMNNRKIDCDEKDADGKIKACRVPYIADYIAGWFKYAVGIGALLGVMVAMIGGFLWVISAGNAQKIGEAKKWITNGIIGIVLLATSYIILYQINPELTKLKSISLEYVNEIVYGGVGCGDSCGKCIVPQTGNCSVAFLKANGGDCFGADIEKMAAICNVESGGKTSVAGGADGCKYTESGSTKIAPFSFGLFQINAVNSAGTVPSCNKAFSGAVDKKNCWGEIAQIDKIKYCKYFKCQPNPNYQQCVADLSNPAINIKAACALYKGAHNTFAPWKQVTVPKCGF
jgi:hypothetical protein